jgi:hypothetical protein
MRGSTFVVAFSVCTLLLGGCGLIKAQPTPQVVTGTLSGVITGPSGPIANASITIAAADATQHTGASNADGYYSIASIPVGPATYSVRASGFADVEGSIVIAADPGPNRQDVSLNPQ